VLIVIEVHAGTPYSLLARWARGKKKLVGGST
jgi:hypothetical protein